ncbi:unnamed protein product [Allacma fusca]|uniref:Uncharacterized protein n=1 Tax=Allacma fusca TaxID=39272 RepID=A0A8J2PAV7_9HEXA|nr:unnamed protein product [Allacma fusca]
MSWNRPEFTNLSFVFNSEWNYIISNIDFTVSSSIKDPLESWRNSRNDIEWTTVPDCLQGEVQYISSENYMATICTLLLALLLYKNTRKTTFVGMLATRIKTMEGYSIITRSNGEYIADAGKQKRQRQQSAQEAMQLREPLHFGDAELRLHEAPRPTHLVTKKAKSKKIQSNSWVAV